MRHHKLNTAGAEPLAHNRMSISAGGDAHRPRRTATSAVSGRHEALPGTAFRVAWRRLPGLEGAAVGW